MRIVTLNIRHGGGSRVEAIADALLAHEADVIVLTEYRANDPGRRLAERLGAAGYGAWADGDPPPATNSVAVTSRLPMRAVSKPLADRGNRHRVVEVQLDGLTLAGVYFPLNAAKVTFWREEFLPLASASIERPYLFLGDWNTGRHFVDEEGATFFAAHEFETLTDSGWTDAWRSRHLDGREFTWYSNRGHGFRLDHAFVSPSLTPQLRGARHDQGTRAPGISDHAALVVDLEDEGSSPEETSAQ